MQLRKLVKVYETYQHDYALLPVHRGLAAVYLGGMGCLAGLYGFDPDALDLAVG